MTENTAIEWADHTFNPWEGCTKVGPGCDHCYAETRNARFGGGSAPNWGPGAPRRRTSESNWATPLAWNRNADAFQDIHGRRQRVFCASLADVFDNEVDPQWRRDLFDLILRTPKLDWLLLTKRIGNADKMLPADKRGSPLSWGCGWPNVWIGATVVNQAEADRDVPKLLALPAVVRFLSIEPMLGPIDLTGLTTEPTGNFRTHHGKRQMELRNSGLLHWVIAGGESGPHARPSNPQWFRDLRDQCAKAGTPFLFKQWGEWAPVHTDGDTYSVFDDGTDRLLEGNVTVSSAFGLDCQMGKVGKKKAGRTLDGTTHTQFPEPIL